MMARSFTDAVGFLVRYLVQQAYNMPANSVRPANQKAPTGAEGDEFATVLITTMGSDFGTASRSYTDDPTADSTLEIETIDNRYVFHASIQFFRHATPANDAMGLSPFAMGAFDKATRLVSRLGASDMLDLMATMNMGIETCSPARNLAALVDGMRWEDRGSVDVTFTIPNSETILLNSIATVTASLKMQEPGRPLVTVPITAEVTT